MFSQVSVCPQSASWILVHCSTLVTALLVGILLECFLVFKVDTRARKNKNIIPALSDRLSAAGTVSAPHRPSLV